MLSTWETFSKRRYDEGREEGRQEGREEGREEREALAKRVVELEEQIRNIRNSNGSSRR